MFPVPPSFDWPDGSWDDRLWLSAVPPDRMDTTGDLQHAFWFEELAGGSMRFVWDGRAGGVFDTIIEQADKEIAAWATDDRHIAYYGVRGDRMFVGVDGTEHRDFEDITRSVPPVFSASGDHVAYGAFVDGASRLILDGKVANDRHLAPVAAVWAPEGERLAYVAESRELKPGERPVDYQQWVVLDEKDLPAVDFVSPTPGAIQFSPDGRRFMYAEVANGRTRVVVDGVPGPFVADASDPTFSPDGRRFAYAAKLEKGMALIDEGRPGPTFDQVAVPAFSSDGSRLLYGARRGKHWSVVIDGVAGPEFGDVWGRPAFSPDGRHVAYLGEVAGSGLLGSRRRHWVVIVDGAAQGEWDEVASEVHFSLDSAHAAFTARRGTMWSVVVDGESHSDFERVGPPCWGSSGKLASVVGQGKLTTIAVDGMPGPWCDEIAEARPGRFLWFSPDGQHVAWMGSYEGAWRPVVDTSIGPGMRGVSMPILTNERAEFIGLAEDGIHRIAMVLG